MDISPERLAIEAGVVGIFLVFFIIIINMALRNFSAFTGLNSNLRLGIVAFSAGALFHIACEAAGINHWYCLNRPQ